MAAVPLAHGGRLHANILPEPPALSERGPFGVNESLPRSAAGRH
jgi:hypothetical protein